MSRSPQKVIVCLAATVLAVAASAAQRHTYADPLDVDYRYNFEQINDEVSYRTGADPAVVNHKGTFYLFMTLADGYWRSTNLIDWEFVVPSRWPMQSIVAPAAWSDGDTNRPPAVDDGTWRDTFHE